MTNTDSSMVKVRFFFQKIYNCTLKYPKNFFSIPYKENEIFQQFYKSKIKELSLYLR